jgi:HEAT repeat protein
MHVSDEFRRAIVNSVPKIVALLTDNDSGVRSAAADALATLSEKGKKDKTPQCSGMAPLTSRS